MKYCPRCAETKDFSDFYKNKHQSGGYESYCKECKKIYQRRFTPNYSRMREYNKKHYIDNKVVYVAKSAKRRAAKLLRTPDWLTEEDLFTIQEVYHLCELRSKATRVEHHVDHIIPLQGRDVSGLHVPSNLQIITKQENLAKGASYQN